MPNTPMEGYAVTPLEGYASSDGGSSCFSSRGKPPSPDASEAPAPAPVRLSATATPRTSEDVPPGARTRAPRRYPVTGAARAEPRSSTEWGPLHGVKRSRSAASLPSGAAGDQGDQAAPAGGPGSAPAFSRSGAAVAFAQFAAQAGARGAAELGGGVQTESGRAAAAFAQFAAQAGARGAAEGGPDAAKGGALPGGAAGGARGDLEARDTCAEPASLAKWEGMLAGGRARQRGAPAKQAEPDAGAGQGPLPGVPRPQLGAALAGAGGDAVSAGRGLQARAAEEAVPEVMPPAEGTAAEQLPGAGAGRGPQGVEETAPSAQVDSRVDVSPSAAANSCGKAGGAALAPEVFRAAAGSGSGKEGKGDPAALFEGPGGAAAPACTWLGTYRDARLERRFCAWQAAQLVQVRRWPAPRSSVHPHILCMAPPARADSRGAGRAAGHVGRAGPPHHAPRAADLQSSTSLSSHGLPACADGRACAAQRDMLGVLLFHIMHLALLSAPAQRAALLRTGYLWVYGVVCLAHTVYYIFAPRRCAGSSAACPDRGMCVPC